MFVYIYTYIDRYLYKQKKPHKNEGGVLVALHVTPLNGMSYSIPFIVPKGLLRIKLQQF